MTEFTDKPGYSFSPGPPKEVSDYFHNKGLRPSFSWLDVEGEEHATQFAVAKAMKLDVLEAIQGALQTAIDEGVPYRQFAKDLEPELRKLGWWGATAQIDPVTGEPKVARLGSPRRLKTIYRANIRSARAAGQWARIQRTKAALPYLLYQLGPSERHRPHHESKEGLVLPADDPFWTVWYPPNGWGCKCWVRQLTRREAGELGVDQAPPIPMKDEYNPRTGEVKSIPAGIDLGWETNPGQFRQRQMERLLAEKLDHADPIIARVAAKDMATSWRAERVLAGVEGAVPVGMVPRDLSDLLNLKSGVVQMTGDYGQKFVAKDRTISTATLAELADALQEGTVALETKTSGEDLIVFSATANPHRFVLKLLRDAGEIWVRTIHRTNPRQMERMFQRDTIKLLRK